MNSQPTYIEINGKRVDRDTFREGFVIGWYECVGDREPDKTKLRLIAEAAADNYFNDTK